MLTNTTDLAKMLKKSTFHDFMFSDEYRTLTEKNLGVIFKEATKLGINRLYIHRRELVGFDDVRYASWPAVWELSKRLRLDSSCGNHDQRQVGDMRVYLDDSQFGSYNTKTGKKIKKLPKSRVVSR